MLAYESRQCGTRAGQVEGAGLATELSWMPCGRDVTAEECMGTEWGQGGGEGRRLYIRHSENFCQNMSDIVGSVSH